MFKLFNNRNNVKFTSKLGKNIFYDNKSSFTGEFFKKSKKKFSNGFGGIFGTPGPVVKMILWGNCIVYGFSWIMGQGDYVKNFFYHPLALNHGKFQTLITSHFAKKNILDITLDSIVIYLIGNQLEFMLGSQVFMKLMIASMGISSILLVLTHKQNYFTRTDALLRGMIMYFVLQNPNQTFILFPLPFNVQAKILGLLIVGMDLISQRYANFGGTFAAFLLIRGII